jgi:hypothetical protein
MNSAIQQLNLLSDFMSRVGWGSVFVAAGWRKVDQRV